MTSVLFAVGPLLAAALSADPEIRFVVQVDLRCYPTTFRSEYTVTPEEVAVAHTERNAEPHRVFHRRLTSEESKAFGSLLRRLPLEGLKSEYRDPDIQDGCATQFEISRDGSPPKSILVANTRQKDLAELCVEINKLVKRKWAIHTLEEP